MTSLCVSERNRRRAQTGLLMPRLHPATLDRVFPEGSRAPSPLCMGLFSLFLVWLRDVPRDREHTFSCRHPRRRVTQYPETSMIGPRSRGVLDHPQEPVIGRPFGRPGGG